MGIQAKKAIGSIITRLKPKEVILPIDNVKMERDVFRESVALICGGSGGIGKAIAQSLYDSGARIILSGSNTEKLRACAQDIGPENRVKYLQVDYLKPEMADDFVSNAAKLFGPIDIFINSVGVHTKDVDYWNVTPNEYDRVMGINLKGSFFITRSVAKHMIDSNTRGHILLVGSSRGYEPAWSPYGLSKWGMRGLTQGLAKQLLPHGIIVNGIAPGSTATSLVGFSEGESISCCDNGAGRLTMPIEVATWARMLVGQSGDMLIGETVLLSGGRGRVDIR